MTFATTAAVISAGTALYGATRNRGGQQGGSSSPATYVPTGQGAADTGWQQAFAQLMQNIQQQQGATSANNLGAYNTLANLPTQGLTQAGQQAGQMSADQAQQALQAQQFLGQNAQNITGAGNQAYMTGFDPRQALYNRTQQQVQDASRAGSAARGINMGGEAAGLENQAMSNFNIDWQNQQLQRQLAALTGMGNAYNQAGRDVAGGLAAGGLAPGYALGGGTIPWGTANTAAGQPLTAANAYNQAQTPLNQGWGNILSSIIPYINQGLGATNQAWNQQQGNYGNILSGLGLLNAPSGGTGSPSNFSAAMTALQDAFNRPQAPDSGFTGGFFDTSSQTGFG